MELYEAIFRRKSTRQYAMEPLPEDTFTRIAAIAGQADRLGDTGLQVHVVRDGAKVHETFKGLASRYVKVIAPHYLIVSSEDTRGWRENSGYVLELVVLEMTRMGLATCWMGGPADREALKGALGIPPSRVVGVFVAFGRPAVDGSQYRADPGEAKRKALAEIVLGPAVEPWPKLLEAARLAPSAVNSQPWRFCVGPGRADLYIARPNPVAARLYGALNPVDAGIALRHVAIAARHYGLAVTIARRDDVEGKKGHSYIASVTIDGPAGIRRTN